MVSQRRAARQRGAAGATTAPGSRDRLLAAAAAEFAARGFDGAKVDRIAAAAGVNKAMLYYHFASKAALYLAIIRAMFAAVATAVTDGRRPADPPDVQLRAFVDTISATAFAHPHFPAMWLREMADTGRHIDRSVMLEMSRVLATLAEIMRAGVHAGAFRPLPPIVVQIGIVSPLLMFAATRPIRERYRNLTPHGLASVPREAFVAHVQEMTLAALAARPAASRRARR